MRLLIGVNLADITTNDSYVRLSQLTQRPGFAGFCFYENLHSILTVDSLRDQLSTVLAIDSPIKIIHTSSQESVQAITKHSAWLNENHCQSIIPMAHLTPKGLIYTEPAWEKQAYQNQYLGLSINESMGHFESNHALDMIPSLKKGIKTGGAQGLFIHMASNLTDTQSILRRLSRLFLTHFGLNFNPKIIVSGCLHSSDIMSFYLYLHQVGFIECPLLNSSELPNAEHWLDSIFNYSLTLGREHF